MLGIISLTLSLIVIILGYIVNRARKNRMRNALGREIRDDEMTSISSWIAVGEAEDRQRQAGKN